MSTSAQQSSPSGRDTTDRAFARIFRAVGRKLKFAAVSMDTLDEGLLDALVQAAVWRCIEFNVAANRTAKRVEEAFFLLSNLRGICEDLIYLTYLSRMEETHSKKLIKMLLKKNTLDGLSIQKQFFSTNNPFQPVLGGDSSSADEHQRELRQFWKSLGSPRRDGPSMRDMADYVGLSYTYEFIYFAASNFVHFNPLVLLRNGWKEMGGSVVFSARRMDKHYRSFSSFYGAVLFVGMAASFEQKHFETTLGAEVEHLVEIIGRVQRWPEIITFEEMNKKPPLYFLTYAIGRVAREEDESVPYGAVLREVQALKRMGSED